MQKIVFRQVHESLRKHTSRHPRLQQWWTIWLLHWQRQEPRHLGPETQRDCPQSLDRRTIQIEKENRKPF